MRRQTLQKQFGRVLRARRRVVGLSQTTLATKTRLHRTYISLLERGERNPSLHIVWRLARGLDLPASALVAELETGRYARGGRRKRRAARARAASQ